MSNTPWREMTDAQKQRHLGYTRRWREANRERENASRRVHRNEKLRVYRDTREGQRQKEAEASKRRYVRLKQGAISALGGTCVRCSCGDVRCLEIDHMTPVRGDHSVYGVKLYRSVVQGNTDGLQVLCANCHAIKTYEDGNE